MMPLEKLWVGNAFKKSLMVEGKPQAIIVDIDGTLSNSEHREEWLEHGYRDQYFDLAFNDRLNQWCADLINAYKSNHFIILLTGRPERIMEMTKKWLDYYDVHYDDLIMRGPMDREQGHIYKQKIYDRVLSKNFNIKLVVDNDPLICEMFRNIGIPALEYAQERIAND